MELTAIETTQPFSKMILFCEYVPNIYCATSNMHRYGLTPDRNAKYYVKAVNPKGTNAQKDSGKNSMLCSSQISDSWRRKG